MIEEQIIPTISLWQPWASALVVSHPKYPDTAIKVWETRSWKCPDKFIGKRVLVHAAKKNDSENSPFLYRQPFADYKNELRRALQYGAIIGSVIIKSCITTEDWVNLHNTHPKSNEERWGKEEVLLGDYSPGRYAWELSDHVWFPRPVIERGFQKIYGTPIRLIESQYHILFK